jgi:uracil-DNA glycosylase family protein
VGLLKAPPPAPGEAPANCRRCDLWKRATQAVNGEGSLDATIMLVGEQPGDEEDRRGQPFVGPAGRLLDEALEEAGLARGSVYITNAVKHFKWEPRGKRRLHKKPGLREINACSVWLEQEITEIAPGTIVALGSTALRALTGATLTIAVARGAELRHMRGARLIASYHPSAILRAEGEHARLLRKSLIADLRLADRLAVESASARALGPDAPYSSRHG